MGKNGKTEQNEKKGKQMKTAICVKMSSSFISFVENTLSDFIKDLFLEEFTFPETLSKEERSYVHECARRLGLQSHSFNINAHRVLTVKKKLQYNKKILHFNPAPETLALIQSALVQYGPIAPVRTFQTHPLAIAHTFSSLQSGCIHPIRTCKYLPVKAGLPTWKCCFSFLELVSAHQVVIVTSETGSGKTTQLPQFILDEAQVENKPCRIICTQPRRLSAIQVATRVAEERGENVGCCVGYQIRLKSRIGPRTSLIYCTSGILLRILMQGSEFIKDFTHIIVDEVHERDKFTDFALMCLKDYLPRYPHVKLILMSATMNVEKFQDYFPAATVFIIPNRHQIVEERHLEEILCEMEPERVVARKRAHALLPPAPVDAELEAALEMAITQCWNEGSDFYQFLHLVMTEDAPVDYQLKSTGYTALMVAAAYGNVESLVTLLDLGANPYVKSHDRMTARDWAERRAQVEARNLLKAAMKVDYAAAPTDYGTLLANYYAAIDDRDIDFELILKLIVHIRKTDTANSILIFLPGYDDILTCHDRIRMSSALADSNCEMFFLHSSIATDYHVFETLKSRQKIILSTNIAETSITIPDVVYVIDSGRVKEKMYDAISGTSSLETTWISRDSAVQRKGRAGRTRPGICYRMFSRERYDSFAEHRTPEILRLPLSELCLLVKKLTTTDTTITSFLNRAIDKPPLLLIQSSINTLKALGALDEDENLTYLGQLLLQLSVDPHLGKMLILSTIFKCVDPILTIVSCLAQNDPFIIPHDKQLKAEMIKVRTELVGNSLSEHAALLRVFQLWQDAYFHRNAKEFCSKHFVSAGSMELIGETRSYLLSQLRAIGFVNVRRSLSTCDLNAYSNNWGMVKAVIAASLFPNFACTFNKKIHTKYEKAIILSASGGFNKTSFAKEYCLVYEELSKKGLKCQMKCTTLVSPLTVAILCPAEVVETDTGFTVTVNDFMECQNFTHELIDLRKTVDNMIKRKIADPKQPMQLADAYLLRTLATILSNEEQCLESVAPPELGVVPKLMNLHRSDAWGRASCERKSAPNSHFSRDARTAAGQHSDPFWSQADEATGSGTSQLECSSSSPAAQSGKLLFFVVTPRDELSFNLARQTNKWHLFPWMARQLNAKLSRGVKVILLFSIINSHAFQGIARLKRFDIEDVETPAQLSWLAIATVPFHLINSCDFIKFLKDQRLENQAGFGCQELGVALAEEVHSLFYSSYQQFPEGICGSNSHF